MNDASIISLYWERSENAIKETDIKYGKLCNHLANNILNNVCDAEECVNDSYLTVWNSIPDERPNNFSAFLCRIVKNLSFKKLEHISAQKRKPEMLVSLNELQDCLSSSTDTETSYDTAELGKIISRFLREQSETNRNISVFIIKSICADATEQKTSWTASSASCLLSKIESASKNICFLYV